MSNREVLISKSKYLNGLQCHKLLWYYYNSKDKIPEVSAGTQAIYDQGTLVGEFAKKLYPAGIEITAEHHDFDKIFRQTKEALETRKPLFEAGFTYKGAYARADVLVPVEGDYWDIVEVKSSTEVKPVHCHDLALQRYVIEGAGLKIRQTFIMHINSGYVRKGEIEPKKLFTSENVTKQVNALLPSVEKSLHEMRKSIELKNSPDISIGPHCSDPYKCPIQEICWAFLPEHNIFTLYRFKDQDAFELLKQGVQKIVDLGADVQLSASQLIQKESVRFGKPYVEKKGINNFLNKLKYPLYFLDFETLNTAIPLYDDVHPFAQVPFQFSLVIQKRPESAPVEKAFLSDGKDDPRPIILDQLRNYLGDTGSIVSYNAGFEKMILRQSSDVYKNHQGWLGDVEPRFVDLLEPFRSFQYYNPAQKGSASMKEVLPALTGKGYDALVIREGSMASSEFLRVTFSETNSEEMGAVRNHLLEYCRQDTMGMLDILTALRKTIQN